MIDMLEHDLTEAQKILKFPPEWRVLEDVDLAGMRPSGDLKSSREGPPIHSTSSFDFSKRRRQCRGLCVGLCQILPFKQPRERLCF